jgi:hypothetical protein
VVDESKKAAMKLREVWDCGSPLPLFHRMVGDVKAAEGSRAAALQDARALFGSATELLP